MSTEPVFSNHAGEPCFNTSGFASSWCSMAYRWNLSYVVDRFGNTMSYWYSTETNLTGLAGNPSATTSYTRFAVLDRVEYGTRAGTGASRESSPTATPPAQLLFITGDRCTTASCGTHDRDNYPDTPWDMNCAASPCPGNLTPSFWSAKRILRVATETWSGSGSAYNRVDEWELSSDFPGVASGSPLWIDSITHSGKAGGSVALPPTTFTGTVLQNRADYDPNGTMAIPLKLRVTGILTESGGLVSVTYSAQDPGCQFGGAFPDSDYNSNRCFPRYWTNPSGMSGWAWWHKYVVTKVTLADLVANGPTVEHNYSYSGDGANTSVMWAHDAGAQMFAASNLYKSWADWRGYPTVVETVGSPSGQRSATRTLYFRGLDQDVIDTTGDGDLAPNRDATITNSLGEAIRDYHQYAGMVHEMQTLDGPAGSVLRKTVTDVTRVAQTAVRNYGDNWTTPGQLSAYITRPSRTRSLTFVPASGSWLQSTTSSTWDSTYGVPSTVDSQADIATTSDDSCTRYSYAFPGSGAPYLVNYPNRIETVGVTCASTPSFPTDAVSDVRNYYDGSTTLSTAPTVGNLTRMDAVVSYTGTSPTVVTQSITGYDQRGRTTSSKDALNHETTTTFTQNTAGLVSSIKQTNPLLFDTTTTYDPRRGSVLTVTDPNGKVTNVSYDALGRRRKVWRPGHPTSGTPDLEYLYGPSQTAASYIRTLTLQPNGNTTSTYDFYDGLLRERQTQVTPASGKRTITDYRYDARGLRAATSTFYDDTTAPTATLVSAADSAIPQQTRDTYDNAGRVLTEELWSLNVMKWATTNVYGGDSTGVIPPSGAASQQVLDATGRKVALRQFQGAALTGPSDQTTFTYDHAGRLTRSTGASGPQWTSHYDMLGRVTQTVDPDSGTSNIAYDAAGRKLTTADGRNLTLAYRYDDLDRVIELHEGTLAGPLRATWSYDPAGAKGQLASSTRNDGGLAYITAVTGYNDSYQPTGVSVTIPPSTANGALANTYTTSYTYATNGALATTTLPAAGSLAAETITNTYSNQGYLNTVTSPLATYVNGVNYSFDGLITQQLVGATGTRVRTLNAFDPATRRLTTSTTGTETSTAGTYLERYSTTYGYDPTGNVTSIAGTTNTGGGLVADQEECFNYDYLRRLTTAWTQTSGTCTTAQRTGADPYWRTWTFDSSGNRLTQVDKDPVAGDTTWNYAVGSASGGTPHQVKTITNSGPLAGPTRTFGYDAAGNTTSSTPATGPGQTLTWDLEGHLATQTVSTSATSYLYDTEGNRLIRRDPDGTATLYLGSQEIKKSPANTLSAIRYYGTYGCRTAAGLTWLIVDHHGTADVTVDAATLTPARRRTLPYGEPRGTQPVWANDKVFVGGTGDPLGTVHLGSREYDPTTGRFISVDPILDLTDPQQWHGYAYANNAPTVRRHLG